MGVRSRLAVLLRTLLAPAAGAVVIFWVALVAIPAHAQIRIQDVPLDLGLAAETKLRPFGTFETATTTASFAVRNVQASLDGTLPSLNSGMACGSANRTQVSFKSISLQQSYAENAPLVINAEAHIRDCHSVPLYEGNIAVSIPVTLSHTAQAVTLQAGAFDVVPSGFTFVGFVPAPNPYLASKTRSLVSPKIANLLAIINAQIRRGVTSVKHLMSNYSVAIQSAKIGTQNGDLVINLQLTGQVPLTSANKWLRSAL
ncbi:hypothetical protein AB8Z38_30645 [Bradyrhizobium sp. LLZ17]|uniref:DUF4403 domain-containing protein n=1 Tax=Bradyrhizobium sp. LLZ17 TaxID=3239388 RepID=A0AB39XG77_9BRAD